MKITTSQSSLLWKGPMWSTHNEGNEWNLVENSNWIGQLLERENCKMSVTDLSKVLYLPFERGSLLKLNVYVEGPPPQDFKSWQSSLCFQSLYVTLEK